MTKSKVTSIKKGQFASLCEHEQLKEATRSLLQQPRDVEAMGEYLELLDLTHQFGHNWVFDTLCVFR